MTQEFKDQFECLEAIANALAEAIEEPWEDLRVDAQRFSDVELSLIKTYLPSSGGKRKDVPFVPVLHFWFMDLAKLVSTREKGFYKKCVFTLTKDGEFNTKYEY
jgi:hypothetical protein